MSITFWGAILWGVVTALEGMGTEMAMYGKALSGFLVAFGIRRAMK